jgi:hypothetical protein
MKIENKNKRDFTRANVHIEAEIITKNALIRGFVGDVSLKGVLLLCDDQLPAGMECIVHLLLGGHKSSRLCVEMKGVVIRNLGNGIAVEFSEIDFDSYCHIKSLVTLNTADIEQVENEFKEHLGLKKVKES